MKIAALNDDGTVITFNNASRLELRRETGEATFDFFIDDGGVQYQEHRGQPGKALADYFGLGFRPEGTPVDPDEIRKGDRYRVEYEIVRPAMELRTSDLMPATQTIKHTSERIADGRDPRPRRFSLDTLRNVRYFLIEAADPHRQDKAKKLAKLLFDIEGPLASKGWNQVVEFAEFLIDHGVKVGDDS